MGRSLVAIAAALLVGIAGCGEGGPPAGVIDLSPSELRARLGDSSALVAIDVRTPEEFAEGHVPGAINIPVDQIVERISEVRAPHGMALYCKLGPRSRRGEAALLAAGYGPLFHLDGGFMAWQAQGLPVERAP
jgi:phage shock protein E